MHGAPPFWRAILASEPNQKMIGKLLFGNVGGIKRTATPVSSRPGTLKLEPAAEIDNLITAYGP
jgi:hypothetical protein